MHDRPTAEELIAAAREHLEREVLPALTDPRLKFRTRVAAHVLEVVEREMGRGERPLREEWGRLQGLLGRSEAAPGSGEALAAAVRECEKELCDRIREGEADEGPFREAVLSHVRAAILEKVRVASPEMVKGMGGG